jgi:hypothetical protein
MPDVRILPTYGFLVKIPDDSDQVDFYRCVRRMVATVFQVELSLVAAKLEHYAPGCEDGRPAVTLGVSLNEGERGPRREVLAQSLAKRLKLLADEAVGGDAGQVKVILDLLLRKTATAG